jgi:hypothetical protein
VKSKLILTESQFNELMYTKLGILTEASKLKILTDKEGLDDDQAKLLDELCGSLSVWMLGKIKDFQRETSRSWNREDLSDKEMIKLINDNGLTSRLRPSIINVMDWIRVGLDGNVKPFKNLMLAQLNDKAKEWHDSLGIGDGDINYKEEHPIIKDFRDENGNGFYWADLETKNSPEECDRMGHCGRSSYGYLYSLREVKPINNKYKINKSHLTTAIGTDGVMYQLKGSKNSKPKEEYHNYILPLFYVKDKDGYLVKGFGTEYASEQDFKLSDLPDEVIRNLYQNRPDLFSGRAMQKKLVDMGIIEKSTINYNITLNIDPDDVGRYVDGDYVYRRYKKKVTSPGGQEYERTVEVTMFGMILAGDTWDLYYNDSNDWQSSLRYHVDDENEKVIRSILVQYAMRENDEITMEDLNEMDTESLIEEYDDNYYVASAINLSTSNAEESDYSDYLYGLLKDALQEYGTIQKMDDTGVILHINTEPFLDQIHDDYLDDYMERCDDDIECTFKEIVMEGDIDRPKWDPDERWYPSVDNNYFNEMLSNYLDDAKSDYGIK